MPKTEIERARAIARHIHTARANGYLREAGGWRQLLVNALANGDKLPEVPASDAKAVFRPNPTPEIDVHERALKSVPDDLRALGFEVTAHIDYQHQGKSRVFWCLTLGSLALKATGATDAEALDEIRRQVAADFAERVRESGGPST
jgi:hypothetical protein